jgi:dipeptidyl-peptidase-4
MGRARGYWWSPDGARLLAARVDIAPVQRWWISDPAEPARAPRPIPYPSAGTANADVSLHVLGLDGTRVEVAWDRAAFEYLASADWDGHGPLIAVQSRDQKTLRVLAADAGSGVATPLHEQRDDAWVELVPGTPARTDSGLLVHCEDRGDTRHLTVGGRTVTPEGMQLIEVVSVDGESVVFCASEEPTEEHLYVYEDGDVRRLSEGPGVHGGQCSGGTTLLSSFTEAGREVRFVREGKSVTLLDLSPVTPLPPRITWLTLGGLELRAALLLPSWHEPGERLPVLLCPYGGPAGRLVARARTPYFCVAQWFAEAGFAVLIADGRGTPLRGPEWERTVYLDTLTYPLEDQVTALHEAAKQYPDLDLDRVGIRGWSFGGTLAAAAVLRRPDVFQAAVAGAPAIDQRLYDTHWRERFLGHPDENPEAYDRSSLLLDAPNLRRPLLLVHGLADDNVVPAHTLRLSTALLAASRTRCCRSCPRGTCPPPSPRPPCCATSWRSSARRCVRAHVEGPNGLDLQQPLVVLSGPPRGRRRRRVAVRSALHSQGRYPESARPPSDRAPKSGSTPARRAAQDWLNVNQLTFTKSAGWPLENTR